MMAAVTDLVSICVVLCLTLPAYALQDTGGGSTTTSTTEPTISKSRPNLIFILTDDQDQVLGGSFPVPIDQATPMPKTRILMQEQGVHASNWYIHTPICSPSRAELLTGRYFHNVRKVGGPGDPDMHVNYTTVDNHNFARFLKEKAGYATGLFGKYTNILPSVGAPPGWDAWLANGGGDYIAPSFHTQGIDGLPDGHVDFNHAPANYSTSVIGNYSIAWIKKVAQQGLPFMAYIAPKAAHEPFNPAPWHRDYWDPSWPEHEPRPENWNCSFDSRAKHHGNIATQPMITENTSRMITGIFKNRWRTLMAVDDLIAGVVGAVQELGLLEKTYFFYSSDHGFQLGQFNIPFDKRQVYEWNTKIHLLIRGPGIAPGSSFDLPGTQVDIAPSLLGLAGVAAPPDMDGKSIVPFFLQPSSPELLESTRDHLKELGDLSIYATRWRREVFIEYYFVDYNVKCTQPCKPDLWPSAYDYPRSDSDCADLDHNSDCWCTRYPVGQIDPSCYATETPANNFIALRLFPDRELDPGPQQRALFAEFQRGNLSREQCGSGSGDALYAEFQSGNQSREQIMFSEEEVDFVEYYDLRGDPWHMHNGISQLPSDARTSLHKRLHQWLGCAGASCP